MVCVWCLVLSDRIADECTHFNICGHHCVKIRNQFIKTTSWLMAHGMGQHYLIYTYCI